MNREGFQDGHSAVTERAVLPLSISWACAVDLSNRDWKSHMEGRRDADAQLLHVHQVDALQSRMEISAKLLSVPPPKEFSYRQRNLGRRGYSSAAFPREHGSQGSQTEL